MGEPLPGQMLLPGGPWPTCWCGHIRSHHVRGRLNCRAIGCMCGWYAADDMGRLYRAWQAMCEAMYCCHLLSKAGGSYEQARKRLARWYVIELD